MQIHRKISRLVAIIEILKRRPNSSMQGILNNLSNRDLDASERSIRRDFKLIRDEFGIEIVYNRSNGGYAIEQEFLDEAEALIRLIELSNSAGLIFESLSEANEIKNLISFEHEGQFQGIEYLEPLLRAASMKISVIITHKHFLTEKVKEFYVNPLLMKEFQGRWYVYGYEINRKHFITLGLDRMLEIKFTEDYFTGNGHEKAKQLFSQVVGINIPDKKLCIVKLKVFFPQVDYFRTLPLHISQEEIETHDKYSIFSYAVIPNYELSQKLLSYGSSIQILEPLELLSSITEELKKSLNNYN